ncbi:uncharacterized protein PG986_002335 [Apiospora aurea]|uniref:DUF7918 domain-containing protein n=1 Tax=Apiospora aurea TaxID=335848 RepID=A0ABR1R056_9PEZI
MAVIDQLKGLEACVEINGQRAQEYVKPDDDEGDSDLQLLVSATKITNLVALGVKGIPHVFKYIESVPDQNFSVHFKKATGFTRQCNHLGVKYTVDKRETGLRHEPVYKPDRNLEWKHESWAIGSGNDAIGWTSHAYKFSEVKHVEEHGLSTQSLDKAMSDARSYGLLAVLVYRMSASEIIQEVNPSFSEPHGLAQEVPEKTLEGLAVTSCTTFDSKPTTKPKWATESQEDVYQDPLQRPCAVFEFRYRSKEGLYQEGVIERPDPVDEMSIEELRRLARISFNQKNKDVVKQETDRKIKQEDGGDSSNRKRSASATVEPPRKIYKETVRDDGKVEVDLD